MNAPNRNPDPAIFHKNDKPREYEAVFRVEGEILRTIMADSEDEAREKAKLLLDNEEFGLELDELSEIRMSSVRKTGPMFLVSRGGRKMQVSHLRACDIPREPDENGW